MSQDAGVASELKQLAEFVVDECLDYIDVVRKPTSDVTHFKDPQRLEQLMEQCSLHIEAAGCTPTELQHNIKTILEETVRTGHQRCINQLFHRADTISILGDWITAAINTSIYTYETAPIVTLMEQEIIQRYKQLLGWATGTGTLPPGGSMSNLYGIVCARTHCFPDVAKRGWRDADRPQLFCSDQAHYSSLKSCGLMGVGYDHCVKVATDASGAMDPAALRAAIQRSLDDGSTPFCVVATAGTTLTGAVDPIDAIADIIAEFPACRIWLHVDGAMGGALIHSAAARGALRGVDRADSFVVNPHKMLGVTLQCSVFLTRHPVVLCRAFCTQAAYLFNADKEYDAGLYDVGDKVFQCGRRPDCLKLWLLWRARGDSGMEAYVDRAIERHRLFNSILARHSSAFRLVVAAPNPAPCTCFWWIPPPAREQRSSGADTLALVRQHADAINYVVPKAKLRMMQDRVAVLTMSKLESLPNFWRMVTNGAVSWTQEEFEDFLGVVLRYCDEIYAKWRE